jgi:hypothetical protein
MLLASTYLYPQYFRSDTLFSPPLKIPLYLSGTFAELRATHFHGGIDLKTKGEIGHPVYATADGYISRIKIQSGGYGKTLYMTHPNGYTTVYAHLDRFTENIRSYVMNYQYSVQRHEVNIYPPKNKFRFSQNELIAYSGNTGRSGGPHLHFEIRKSLNQVPQNGLLYNFPIIDNIKPKVYHLALYPKTFSSHVDHTFHKKIISLNGLSDTITIKSAIPVHGHIGFGVETYDYADNSANPCGIYSMEVDFNGNTVYSCTFDEVSFSETRYINSFVDFEEKQHQHIKIQKLFRDPANELSIYHHLVNDGIIYVDDSLSHNVQIRIDDAYGNRTVILCDLKGIPQDTIYQPQDSNIVETFHPHQANSFNLRDISVSLPAKTLYDSIYFTYFKLKDDNNPWSDIHQVHKFTTPAHTYFTVGIRPKTTIPEKWKSKAVVCLISEEDTSSVESRWENGMLIGRTRKFGNYTIKIDSLAPDIKPLSFIKDKNVTGDDKISFTINDNMSGIDSYNGYIDGNWVLFEYDAKNNLLFYEIDDTRLKKGKKHDLELYVSDGQQNIATYFANVYY